ncbi:hypothetical protein NE606_19205, partial [Agathobaculum butyriciproducens]|nr:hypothetical protein [Agathobaculum butyriciproducens]
RRSYRRPSERSIANSAELSYFIGLHLRFWEEAVYIQVVATGYDTLRQLVGDLPTAEPHLDRILGTMRERSDLGDE